MDIETLRTFFMWCSIINGGMLIFSFLFISLAGDLAYKIQGRKFSISRETFNAAIYCMLGGYKLAIIVFNLVPFIALCIVD